MAEGFTPFPTQSPQGIPGDFLSVPAASPAAFGAEAAQGVSQAGRQVLDLVNENVATDLQTKTGQKLAGLWGKYQGLQGKDAIDAAPQFMEDVRQTSVDAIASAPNLKVRALVGQGLAYLTDRTMYQGQNHADQQLKTYTTQVDTNSGNFHYDQMATAILEGDDQHAAQSLAAGDDSYMHLHHDVNGLDPVVADQETSKVRSTYLKAAIGQVLVTEPERGIALFNQYKGQMAAGTEYQLLPTVIGAQGKLVADKSLDAIKSDPDAFVDGIPNKEKWLKKAGDLSENAAVRAKAFSEINNQYEQYSQAVTSHREIINKDFPNLIQAAKDDPDHVTFPRDEIRAFYPGDTADYMEREFNTAKAIGTALQQVPTATPATLAGIRKSLETGTGVTADQLRLKLQSKAISDPGAITIPIGSNEDAEFQKMRGAALKQFDSMMTARNKALTDDPAGLAWSTPSVKAAADKINQDDPATVTAYLQAVKAQQATFGVPDNQQRVLPREVAANFAKQIMNAPNPAQAIMGIQAQWGGRDKNGNLVPGGFGDQILDDIVSLGKLPTAYEAVASLMDNPNHPDASDTLSKGLKAFTGEKASDIEKFIPASTKNDIDKEILSNPSISKMVQSFNSQNMTPARQSALMDSVKMLAYSEMAFNGAGDFKQAAQRAVDAFTDDLDLSTFGNAAMPKKFADGTQQRVNDFLKKDRSIFGTGRAESDFFNSDILIPPGQDKTIYLRAVRAAPLWVNSPDGKGLNLIGPLGGVVRTSSGSPVMIPFENPGPPTPSATDPTVVPKVGVMSNSDPVGMVHIDPNDPGAYFIKLPNNNWSHRTGKPPGAIEPVAAPPATIPAAALGRNPMQSQAPR